MQKNESLHLLISRMLQAAILILVLGASPGVFAQVPFSRVKKDLLKEYTGVKVIERKPGVVEIDKTTIPHRKYYYAYATVSNAMVIDGHKVTHHRDVVATYDITRKPTYAGSTKSDEWLVGDLVPPTFQEVQDLFQKQGDDVFDSYMSGYVTQVHGIKEIVQEKYPCHECTHFYFPVGDEGKTVHFRIVVEYSRINGMKMQKRRSVFAVRLVRDGIGQPWKNFPQLGNPENLHDNVLEERDLTQQELKTIDCSTLKVKAAKQKATAYYNGLPKVEIPKFTKAQDMVWWLHRFLRKARPDEAEYVMMNLLSPGYFLSCGGYMLSDSAQEKIQKIKKVLSLSPGNYGEQYCEIPVVHHQQGDDSGYMVQFYPKTGNIMTRIHVSTFNNQLKVYDIQLAFYSDPEEIQQVMQVPASQCKENIVAVWKNHSLSGFGISAMFPAVPAPKTFPDRPGKQSLEVQFDGAEWGVAAEKLTAAQAAKLQGSVKMNLVAKDLSRHTRDRYEATPGSDRVWQINGVKGYESNWTVKKGTQYVDMKYRAVVYNGVFYEIWVLGPFENEPMQKFMNSVVIR